MEEKDQHIRDDIYSPYPRHRKDQISHGRNSSNNQKPGKTHPSSKR